MPSRRELIVQALVAALDGADKPAGLTVHRFRTRPLVGAEDLPAVVVYLQQETTARGDGPHGYKARRACTIRVECRTRVAGDAIDTTAPDAALDALTSWAVRAVMADPRQGGLAHNTQETATQWAAEETDAVYAAAAVDFTVDFITAAGDPDAS